MEIDCNIRCTKEGLAWHLSVDKFPHTSLLQDILLLKVDHCLLQKNHLSRNCSQDKCFRPGDQLLARVSCVLWTLEQSEARGLRSHLCAGENFPVSLPPFIYSFIHLFVFVFSCPCIGETEGLARRD